MENFLGFDDMGGIRMRGEGLYNVTIGWSALLQLTHDVLVADSKNSKLSRHYAYIVKEAAAKWVKDYDAKIDALALASMRRKVRVVERRHAVKPRKPVHRAKRT